MCKSQVYRKMEFVLKMSLKNIVFRFIWTMIVFGCNQKMLPRLYDRQYSWYVPLRSLFYRKRSVILLGSLSNDNGSGSENATQKWIHVVLNFIALIPTPLIWQMLAIFQEWNSKWLYLSSQKQKENYCLVFASSIKHEIRKIHVVVMQWWQRNIQKSMKLLYCKLIII